MELGYRQVIALLLGTAIMLIAFSFVYNWHNHFNAYMTQMQSVRNTEMTSARPIDKGAIAHMAITYCADQLAKVETLSLGGAFSEDASGNQADVLTFYDGSQQLTIDQLLESDANRLVLYKLRGYQGRNFEIEVSYD